MINILTSGDSHGYGLFGIIEGFPAHFKIDVERINNALKERQTIYGRGIRMNLESDHVEILSGIWKEETTGAPITFFIKNQSTKPPVEKTTTPRPGHADLGGMVKYLFDDARVITERASARRTAMDVAIGEFFRQALEKMNVKVISYTLSIGNVETQVRISTELHAKEHPLLCPDEEAEKEMMREIDKAKETGYTLGGKVKVLVMGVPIGFGTYNSYENRLSSLIARTLFDIPSVKGVNFGDIETSYKQKGTQVMDEIKKNGERKTNHAGGIEGGVTNGQALEMNVLIKPIPTQKKGMETIDLRNGQETLTSYVRSDTCVVGAVSLIARSKVSTVIFEELIKELGGSTFQELKERLENYKNLRKRVIFHEK